MFPLARLKNATTAILVSVFSIQIVFMVAVAVLLAHYDATVWQFVQKQDSSEYFSLAQSLLADGTFFLDGYPAPETFRTIGYPAIIAVIFGLTGGSTYAPGRTPPEWGDAFYVTLGFLALAGAVTSATMYAIGKQLGLGSRAATAAALLFGISPAVIFIPLTGMGSDIVFTCVFVLALALFVQIAHARNPYHYAIGIGILMGVGTLCRPVGQFFALLLFCIIPFMMGPSLVPSSRAWRVGGTALAVFLIVISPWLARNYLVSGHVAISSIPVYSFANYNIPGFLTFYAGVPAPETEKQILARLGNPPGILYRSFRHTDALATINREFLSQYLIPYSVFHIYKTLPFFLGSGIDVSYAGLAIETQWRLQVPFLPHVDENLSSLVYAGDYLAVMRNLVTYWPATAERLLWLLLLLLTLAAPFIASERHVRIFFFTGILMIGMAAMLASPVAQPRYRVPVEPFIWLAAAYVVQRSLAHQRHRQLPLRAKEATLSVHE